MVVVRYKQPETADAARPADPDALAGAVRRPLPQTGLGSCPGSGDRRRSGSWTAHRNRRAVGARTARRDGFRPLPWRAQPRPLVRAVAGPCPAALAGRSVCSGWPGGGWDRRDDRAALGAEDLGARHLQRPGSLLARPLCQGLRWITVMLLVHIPGAGGAWGRPSLTTPAPWERFPRRAGRRHRPLADWDRQFLRLA